METNHEVRSHCALCHVKSQERICNQETNGKHPAFCATIHQKEALQEAQSAYTDETIRNFAVQASRQEAACYASLPNDPETKIPQKTRIQEIAEFCLRMGYKRIGLAFCSGVQQEAEKLVRILRAYDLEVISVICKVGGVKKESIGLSDADKISPGRFESMCNPIAQAMILNEAHTEFNLVMGLCVGHDSLFFKYSEALCTVVAAKDRLLGHNPMAALYSAYYNYLSVDQHETTTEPSVSGQTESSKSTHV